MPTLLHKEHAAVCCIELLEAYRACACRMRAGDAIAHEHEEVINQSGHLGRMMPCTAARKQRTKRPFKLHEHSPCR